MQKQNIIPPLLDISVYSVNQAYDFHTENYYIFMTLNGSILIKSDDHSLTYYRSDMTILPPEKTYTLSPLSENTILRLILDRSFINDHLGAQVQIVCDSAREPYKDYSALQKIISTIVTDAYDKSEDNKFQSYAHIFELLSLISKNYLVRPAANTSEKNHRHTARIQEITEYIHVNYQTTLTLKSLADTLYLTPQYLSKFFKQHFHQTFYDYLNQVRMEHALIELKNTNYPITKIAFNNGFPNLTAFNKNFKEMYEATPSLYRKQLKQTPTAEAPLPEAVISEKNFENARSLFEEVTTPVHSEYPAEITDSHANFDRQTIEIDVRQSKTITMDLTGHMNVGFASNLIAADFQQQLLAAQQAIGFKYVRFLGILDEDILPQIHSEQFFNFSKIDAILDFLIRNKLTPFIELSEKPRKTSVAITETGQLPLPDDLPKQNEYYYQKLEAFIRHCINRFGSIRVSGWYFELWAMHTDHLIFIETASTYVKRFIKTRNKLNEYLHKPLLGGPGFNVNGPMHLFEEIVREMAQRRIQPAFISVYLYPYEFAGYVRQPVADAASYALLSPNENIFSYKMDLVKTIIQRYYIRQPAIYVTEYNSDLTTQNNINDSRFQAAFICKNMLMLYKDVDVMNYWLLSDLSEEFSLFKASKQSGICLLRSDGQKKPAFFAYEFLNHMGRNEILSTPNVLVTARDINTYQILAFNYAHLSNYFCLNHTDQVNFENIYDIFEEKPPVQMRFCLTHLTSGLYKIKSFFINKDHGSIIDEEIKIWHKSKISRERLLYNLKNLTQEEARSLRRSCVPEQSIYFKDVQTELELECRLDPHDVILFEITRELIV